MSSTVPEGWVEATLDDFAKFRRGTTYVASELSDNRHNHPLYITMKSFNVGGGYSERGDKFYSSPYKKKQILGNDELLIANTDVTPSCAILGSPLLLPSKIVQQDVLFSHHVTAAKLNGEIDKDFLFYLLSSPSARLMVQSCGRGTTVKMLDMREIGKLSFPIPPLPEQKNISSILTSVDEVIENTQKQINKLQDLKKATMNELLTKGIGHTEFKDSELGRIPRSWEIRKLGEVTDQSKGLTYKSTDYGVENQGLPFLTLKSISKSGGYSPLGLKFFKSDFKPNHVIGSGDILFANTDLTRDGDVVGSPLYFDGFGFKTNPLYSMDLSKLEVNPEESDGKFLYYLLMTHRVKRFMVNSSAGSTVLHLDTKRVKELPILLPPLPEQKKIASILTSVDEVIENTQNKLQQSLFIKKSLMQDLLTGKVRVKEN